MRRDISGRQHDIENIQRAERLATEIADWVQNTPNWPQYAHFRMGYDGWVIDLQRIGNPDLRGLYLILVNKDNPYFVGSGFGFSGDNPVIVLKMLDHQGIMNPYLGGWLSVGYRQELEHELVHYLDWRRSGVRMQDEERVSPEDLREEEGWVAYANHPFELNARFQEATTTLVRLSTHPKEEVRNKTREVFLTDYPMFRASVWKQFDPDWIEVLTEDNLQRLEKRLYQLWNNLRELD